jgi:hypothetical protein
MAAVCPTVAKCSLACRKPPSRTRPTALPDRLAGPPPPAVPRPHLRPLPRGGVQNDYAQAFGSWHTTIRYRGRIFRVVLDGKEQAYFLEESMSDRPPYSWKQAGAIETAGEDPWRAIVEVLVMQDPERG